MQRSPARAERLPGDAGPRGPTPACGEGDHHPGPPHPRPHHREELHRPCPGSGDAQPLSTPRFQLEEAKKTFQKEALRTFDELRKRAAAECSRGTEIIGALKAAGERARKPGRILVLAHGFEQSELMNLYDYRLKLEKREVRQGLLQRVKARLGLPNLKDQEVCIAGITAGNDNNANARLTTSIKAFWEELIQASGGRLVGYGTTPRVCPFL